MLDTASPAAKAAATPPEKADPPAATAAPRPPLWRREALALALFAFFALAPAIAQVGAEGYLLSLVIRAMIFAIAALSLDLILGYGALVSFGHAAFVGIGCYAVGILMAHAVPDLFVQLLVTLLASALFAFVTGAISLRTKGVYFIMITLAFGQMVYFLTTSLAPYGGDDGLTLPSRSTVLGTDVLENDLVFYYLVLACLVGVYAMLRAIVGSRFGRVLRGTKENPVRMQAIGYDPYRYQLCAYVIAGMIAGLAGFLLANQLEFVSPAFISWQRSGELIIMVVLGGMGTLVGPIVGAMSFLFLEEILARITQDWKLIFGPLLVLVALFARGGILGFFKRAK
ncbi:branched-chain amino acid ABC transporter permease [Salinarimonas sp. NSM]|uniref:branched-chain amino acid ABC transporter permease n=1 Tax=Salinarimonas sp. NSM TaxID=3458003 RepID=UPI0040355E95